jgi:hypothetical protein
VRIETGSRSDAECIAEALGVPLSRSASGWLVRVEIGASTDFARFLSALQSCLEDHAIPAITIDLDDDRYVMEG